MLQKPDLHQATQQYMSLATQLGDKFPDAIADAKALAAAVVDPNTATAEQIWPVLWDKPLYANTRVDIATKKIAAVSPIMGQPGIWRQMRHDSGDFAIRRVGKGTVVEAFAVTGPAAREIVEDHGVARHRLYAIIGAAQALSAREKTSTTPMSDVTIDNTRSVVEKLRSELGFGWGAITALHFMTDIGRACKPDIWLATTSIHLGVPVSDRRVTKLDDILAIDEFVKQLTRRVYGVLDKDGLRQVDKIMMEIGKRGLLK